MAHNPLAVANYFLELAKTTGGLDPMKVQKLIYFAHGWHLALHGENAPLINEPTQAWEYGPVVQSVYHEFKSFGGSKIDRLGTDFDMATGQEFTPRVPLSDEQAIPLLNKIWEIYGKYSGLQLSHLTHQVGSAWYKTRQANPGMRFAVIQNADIRAEFAAKVQHPAQ